MALLAKQPLLARQFDGTRACADSLVAWINSYTNQFEQGAVASYDPVPFKPEWVSHLKLRLSDNTRDNVPVWKDYFVSIEPNGFFVYSPGEIERLYEVSEPAE